MEMRYIFEESEYFRMLSLIKSNLSYHENVQTVRGSEKKLSLSFERPFFLTVLKGYNIIIKRNHLKKRSSVNDGSLCIQ